MRRIVVSGFAALTLAASWAASGAADPGFRSLDGNGNNVANPTWGQAGTQYLRVAPPNYADGIASMQPGPPTRYISNRIFNDRAQNIFSENDITQWGWTWAQFMDHTFGLRDETPAEPDPIAFSTADPLEQFRNDFGAIDFARTPAAPGTGVSSPRQHINTVSSYIDAFNIYGGTDTRLAWLRSGADLMLTPDGYLPPVTQKENPPPMDLMGRLVGQPDHAIVSGDVRANENIALTATHTLFAREHNRIVAALPAPLTDDLKFQIARRIVDAEEQYVTYHEFLPALGVKLAPYTGYKPDVNASLSNEFAVVGYRGHSMIHGEFDVDGESDTWTQDELDAFAAQGIEVNHESGGDVALTIPLNLAFGNPDLLTQVGLGPMLGALSNEREYKNDEQIDNQLRSVLFQVPGPDVTDPNDCLDADPRCFNGVVDLGAIDVERGRDHGMPTYNQMRQAYGLPARTTFQAITGESTSKFPVDPLLGANPIDSPHSLDFVLLRDRNGAIVQPGTPDEANAVTTAIRRTPIAARLKAIYGDVDKVDAFVGMVAEPHIPGTEFGELQLAMWKKQFEALRDGDRFFYASPDSGLQAILDAYPGIDIDYRQTLAQIIHANTGETVPDNVFKAVLPPAPVPGLVASYGFDEGPGNTTVADGSGRGNVGSLTDTSWVAGQSGSALSFNGSSSSVTIPDSGALDLTSGMTLEAWVKPAALGSSWRTVVFKEQPGGMVYSLYANKAGGKPVGQVNIGAERNVNGPAALPLDTWSHLAVTYDGSQMRLYVNGALVATRAQKGSIPPSSGPVRIGGNSIWGEWFNGAIDEVRVYDRAITPDEIANDMATPVGPTRPAPPAVLVGDQQVETDVNPTTAGVAEAFSAIASTSAPLRSVSVYVDAASTATSLVAGVYTDAGGHPGTLLGQGSIPAPARGAWNEVQVPPAALAAGTSYWIAILGPGGALAFRDRCCSVAGDGPTETSAQTNLAVLPATWSPGTVYDDGPISAYGSA